MGPVEVNGEALAVVTNDGTVMWIPPATTKVSCSGDGSYPYELQVISVKYCSLHQRKKTHFLDNFSYFNVQVADITIIANIYFCN